MTRPKDTAAVRKKVEEFGALPDDAHVSVPVAAAVWGVSPDTYLRDPPVPPRRLSKRLTGVRVGDLRRRSRE